jgi:hypothetical protein
MSGATKTGPNSWYYRGFTICRNFTSCHGTGHVCASQQGFRTTPMVHGGGGISGDWTPTLKSATARIDDLHARYEAGGLQAATRDVVEEARRIAVCEGCPVIA